MGWMVGSPSVVTVELPQQALRGCYAASMLKLVSLGSAAVFAVGVSLGAQDQVRGHLLTFQDNGAWSWFEDERAVVDRFTNKILVGSCADDSGLGGAARGGDIDVACFDLATGRFSSFELRDRLQGDDHNSPALLVRPDGRYLAMYGMHGGSGTAPLLSRWRVSVNPGDASVWATEQSFQHTRAMSYSNLHHLPDAFGGRGVTYNFVRATNFDPNVMVSNDLGQTWTGTGKLLTEGGTGDRPYLKYSSDGSTKVHVLATERHPRDYENSVYHGYVEDGRLHDSFGNVLDVDITDGTAPRPNQLTPVFTTRTVFNGTAMRRGWTVDLEVHDDGSVRALFIARALDVDTDHRLFEGRFDGTAWTVHEICAMGAYLYQRENDYTGLGALHPQDPNRLFVSTKIDPRNGNALGHYEIFDGVTADGGQSWSWTPVTEDSTVDNLRPIMPEWAGDRVALLWFRGRYNTYTDFDCAVVGIVDAPELRIGTMTYHDASPANTTLPNGFPVTTTGPSTAQGANEGLWHRRSGFGNGGEVWTSSEGGNEDVPEVRTRVAAAAGSYDVFLLFWSNPNEDWLIRAGLETGELRSFERLSTEQAAASDFTHAVTLSGSTVRLYKAYLGRVKLASSGSVDVFVDDWTGIQSGFSRTWYDGIGLAPVRVPAGVDEVGRGCGAPPVLAVQGSAVLGGPGLDLSITTALPMAAGFAVYGVGDLQPVDLSSVGFRGCTIYPAILGALSLGAVSGSGSTASVNVPVPGNTSLLGATANFQGAVAGVSGSLGLTSAWVARLGG